MAVTIVFRGLMVFVKLPGEMQIGVLRAPGHIPRILTITNGVLDSILDLRLRPELDRVRDWKIEVMNPTPSGISIYTDGTNPPFKRLASHPNDPDPNDPSRRDFRWIADLEAADLHDKDLSSEIETRLLRFVVHLQHGTFATRLLSPFLLREDVATTLQVPYGPMAAASECSISFGAGGSVQLTADGATAFDFQDKPNTIYEFSHTPPDVDPNQPHRSPGGHFQMYYDCLFKHDPRPKFNLVKPRGAPAPDPQLCGATLLGLRTTPL